MAGARFEIVRTDAGWHARVIAVNGRRLMSSEVYSRRRGALRAATAVVEASRLALVRDVDERTARP